MVPVPLEFGKLAVMAAIRLSAMKIDEPKIKEKRKFLVFKILNFIMFF